jgi:outer membrane protein assembly factor BamB
MLVSPASPRIARASGTAAALAWIIWATAWAGVSYLAGVAEGQVRVVGPTVDTGDEFSQVHLPTDRALTRATARAEQRLRDGEYHDALVFFQQMLERQEDSFLDDAASATDQVGLKATARRLIAGLPPKGRETYELLYGTTARRQLDAALAAGHVQGIAEVVRQYFHTSAGYEAALIFAQMEADRGHCLTAAQTYQELLDSPAADRFEPQLSVLAAVNWAAAGEQKLAAATMRSLAKRKPGATIDVGGRSLPMPQPDDDQLAWLSQLVGRPNQPGANGEQWLTKRGDASRNSRPRGGAPHLRARWEARVVSDPKTESYLTDRGDQLAEQGTATLTAACPIAVGNVVLMRTPENLVAIDWHTGKRIWETRPEDVDEERLSSELSADDAQDWSELGQPLEQRVWDDALAASLSSDGQRVFAISGLPLSSPDESAIWRIAPALGGAGLATPVGNRLVAYELASEGKLVWEIDGARATGELAGAFFLGAPLAIDNSLLVMAEIRSAIYLLALDPRTGKLQWQQQLADLELGIGLDLLRRQVGSTPSYAGGILVCPTAAGVVVAVDVVKRELAWVYRYPRHFQSPADEQPVWQQPVQNRADRGNDRWLDATVLIADGRVLVTSPESAELHCLDLRTGRRLWKHARGDALYVACVDQERVLLVGPHNVESLRLEDGSPAWPGESVTLPNGALPAGRGYLSEGRYYLPLTSGQVAAVDIAAGTIASSTGSTGAAVLGNLICCRGSVISQSALVVDKFEQTEVLRQRAEAALAQDPNDPTALRELADLRRVDGELAEAIDLLKRAHQLDPDEPLTREMLAENLIVALASDFASHRGDLGLLRSLVDGNEQQLDLLRIEAEGSQAMGDGPAAWKVYLQIADMATGAAQLEISSDYTVRSDRWVAGRLQSLWAEASADQRQVMADELAARHDSFGPDPATARLRHYLAHFGQLPAADGVRLQLARQLIEERFMQEAEVELLELGQSTQAESQAGAAALMVRLMIESDRTDEATPYVALLADRWKDVVALDGLTGSEWLRQQGLEAAPADAAPGHDWPRGRVTADVEATSPLRQGRLVRGVPPQRGLRELRFEQDYPPSLDSLQWLIASDCSQLVGRDRSGQQLVRLDIQRDGTVRQYRINNSDNVQAARLGHLLYVSLGNQIIAFEARPPDSDENVDVLWQAYSAGRLPPGQPRAPVRRSNVYDPRSGRKRYTGPAGLVIGALGPATPRGVVFHQEQHQLKCVDPVTGELLWQRSDVPPACELFGDGDAVIAADVEDGTARVFDMTDGSLRGERPLPPLPWLLTAGRNVACVEHRTDAQGSRMVLRVVDVWSGDDLLAAEYDAESRLTVVEPNKVVMVEPSGRFQLIDVRAGSVLLDKQLAAMSKPQFVHALLSDSRLFLVIDTHSRQQRHQQIGTDYPVFDGQVYALDARTGESLWPGPAVIKHRGLALIQPEDIPILVFIDRMINRDASGTSTQLRLLCVDKQTGRTVYRNDGLPDTAGGLFHIRARWDTEPEVSIDMSSRTVRLTFTDQPRPPEPPANDDLEAVRGPDERGLWGVGRRMGNVLQNALQHPPETDKAAPAPRPDDDGGP